MTTGATLEVLLVPIVIAVTTVAAMLWWVGRRDGGAAPAPTVKPDPATALSMTLVRYVGGHPMLAAPLATPFALLTDQELAVYARRNGPLLFTIPWSAIEQVTLLDRPQMEAASVSVRGLAPGAIEAARDEATFLRVRFHDERGWWQNVIFELGPPHGEEQGREVLRYWERHRGTP